MEILEKDIHWYINKMRKGEHFSFPGYSDSEWFCILGHREGTRSGYGQLHTEAVGGRLEYGLRHKQNFYPAFPKALLNLPQARYIKQKAETFNCVWFERDMVTDDLAAEAGLFPFIKQLQDMNVYIIGNKHLRGLEFLNYQEFFEIPEQDAHLSNDIDLVVEDILNFGEEGIYLFSGGISAAMMIGELHGKINSTLFDCGSIWDAFVGIGGHRGWREELYKDPKLLEQWKNKNLYEPSKKTR